MNRVTKRDGKYYVVDGQGNELDGPFDTFAEANRVASGSPAASSTAKDTSASASEIFDPGVRQPNVGAALGSGQAGTQTEPVDPREALGIDSNLTEAAIIKAIKTRQITVGQGYELLRSKDKSDQEAAIILNNAGIPYSPRRVSGGRSLASAAADQAAPANIREALNQAYERIDRSAQGLPDIWQTPNGRIVIWPTQSSKLRKSSRAQPTGSPSRPLASATRR